MLKSQILTRKVGESGLSRLVLHSSRDGVVRSHEVVSSLSYTWLCLYPTQLAKKPVSHEIMSLVCTSSTCKKKDLSRFSCETGFDMTMWLQDSDYVTNVSVVFPHVDLLRPVLTSRPGRVSSSAETAARLVSTHASVATRLLNYRRRDLPQLYLRDRGHT